VVRLVNTAVAGVVAKKLPGWPSKTTFARCNTWEIICEEMLDTTFACVYFERARCPASLIVLFWATALADISISL
jgi:hypothetical protein